MGHTTLNIYAQVLDGSVREAAERDGRRLITIDHSAQKVASDFTLIGLAPRAGFAPARDERSEARRD